MLNTVKSALGGKTLLLIISLTIFIPGTRDSLFAQDWFVAHSDTNSHFNSVFFTDANTGYTTGREDIGGVGYFPRIWKTTNAGINWVEQTTPQRDSAGFFFPDVFFTDMNTGFIAAAYNLNPLFGRILKTTDGGDNWFIVPIPVTQQIWEIHFINSSTGYASGYKTLLKTTDAGATWVDKHFPTYLNAIHFTDINTGYAVADHGHILKTTDGGTDWDRQKPTNIHLNGVSFADANTGIAVGGLFNNTANIILRTTNAGLNWTEITYNYSTCNLLSVRFVNPTTGWIVGHCSQILKTTDGGASWFNQTPPVNNSYFRGCFFTSALTGYIAAGFPIFRGGVGYILKTTDGGDEYSPVGIEPISNEVPAQFQLYQNYPNPFNPTTKIRFALPKNSFAKLVVYDMLGREIAILVNEQLNAGTYEAEWNAAQFSSGVYYYKLTVRQAGSSTEDYIVTRKMILIK
jgi:photosystem II stability/assembly factor-like uncharacterized protein